MKRFFTLITVILLTFFSCDSNEDSDLDVTLKFTHNWDGVAVTNQDFNDFKFTTANGESVSIERLRYLVSNISLTRGDNNYSLVDIGENSGNLITTLLQPGEYNLSFTFGFTDADNQDGAYQDLNSVNFNVPSMLGGGYHYMQFDGKYKDNNNQDAPFNYHAIRAVDRTDPNNLMFEDTSFIVTLGTVTVTKDSTIEVKMDIAEWFKRPNLWDLNQLNTVLMPNFDAQKQMSANGKTAFSLGEITED